MPSGVIGKSQPDASLNTIQEISGALQPAIGTLGAKVYFGLGMVGAAFLAALVVSLAGAWVIGEAFGFNHSLNLPFPKKNCFIASLLWPTLSERYWPYPVFQ